MVTFVQLFNFQLVFQLNLFTDLITSLAPSDKWLKCNHQIQKFAISFVSLVGYSRLMCFWDGRLFMLSLLSRTPSVVSIFRLYVAECILQVWVLFWSCKGMQYWFYLICVMRWWLGETLHCMNKRLMSFIRI